MFEARKQFDFSHSQNVLAGGHKGKWQTADIPIQLVIITHYLINPVVNLLVASPKNHAAEHSRDFGKQPLQCGMVSGEK